MRAGGASARRLLVGLTAALLAPAVVVAGEDAPSWDQVRPLVARHCTGCHRAGGVAPFSLETWEQARPWARAMRRSIETRSMPPWHADPAHGEFLNDRRLPEAARAVLLEWLDAGAPRGAGAPGRERRATLAPRAGAWRLGEPDAVLELPPVEVPASGEVRYHDYRLGSPFDHDVWLRGVEVLPGNPRVVHHVIVEAFDPVAALRRGGDPRTAGSLGGYVPGDEPRLLPEGTARRLAAGSEIVLQIHYTPSGDVERDATRIGLFLSARAPRRVVRSGIVSTPFLWIPAGSVGVEGTASHVFEESVRLLSLRPHLHLRGRSFEFRARSPDGVETILLRVPRWDFDWQTTYVLTEPLELSAGTELVAIATWDNSADNPDNPDPGRDVSWGEGTDDEMMIGFFDYLVAAPAEDGD